MQKVKITERLPAKVWAALFLVLLIVVVALLFIFIPGAWDGFLGLIMTGFTAILGFALWCIGDIRFIIGAVVVAVPVAVIATRKYWHKQTVLIPTSPVASTTAKLSDVPGGELFDKNVEKAD